MTRVWRKLPLFMGVLLLAGICAYPQDSISARPGTINYVEGRAYLNGDEVMQRQIGRTSLNIDQYLRTADRSKAEVLLTPGVFLRLGESSEIRMVTPSLTDTKVAVTRGEVLVEVAQLYKGNHIEILNNGASTVLLKNGLYRFNAEIPDVAVIDGKATVSNGDSHVDLKKGREVVLTAGALKASKFDREKEDDLYAWSNVRSEYVAAASYASARTFMVNSYGGYGSPYGWFGSGWYWNPGFDSWAFVPGDGFFYSPFGWGFYSPAYIGYAPIYYLPGRRFPVPVNPNRPHNHMRPAPGAHSYSAYGSGGVRGGQSNAFRGNTSNRGVVRSAPSQPVFRGPAMGSPGVTMRSPSRHR